MFYSRATTTGPYAPTELVGSFDKMKIAQKNQKDANGRRAVVRDSQLQLNIMSNKNETDLNPSLCRS